MKDAPDENPGNFMALLQFRVQSGDTILAEHLQSAHKHRNINKTIQNEIIDICGNLLHETILENICAARFFSTMVDEATDVHDHNQISFVKTTIQCARDDVDTVHAWIYMRLH